MFRARRNADGRTCEASGCADVGDQSASSSAARSLGAATRADVVLPVSRAVTIRPSTLSDDRGEFHILIKEACDHTIKAAAVTVMQTPLTVQLTEMKFANDALTVEAAIPRLKFERTELLPRGRSRFSSCSTGRA